MNNIKNLHLLEGYPSDQIDMMEHAALQHKRFAGIAFKILEADSKSVTIQISQGRSGAENYFDTKRLVEIVHETFGRFFEGKKILVHPIPFVDSPANQVNAEWINKRMGETGIKLKDIEAETGISKSQLSGYINDSRPLSQPIKALFYLLLKERNDAAHGIRSALQVKREKKQGQSVSQGEGSGNNS